MIEKTLDMENEDLFMILELHTTAVCRFGIKVITKIWLCLSVVFIWSNNLFKPAKGDNIKLSYTSFLHEQKDKYLYR